MSALSNCKQAGSTVAAYYAKFKLLWNELANYEQLPAYKCGMQMELIKQNEEIKVHQFLLGLENTIFSTIRYNILQIDPILSILKVYAMITTEEQHKQVAKSTDNRGEAVAFATVKTGIMKLQCTHGHKIGHNVSACFQKIGYLEWWPEKGMSSGSGDAGCGIRRTN